MILKRQLTGQWMRAFGSTPRQSQNAAPATSVGTASTDVVIIGGGVIGCSTAYNLAKLGVPTILLEKSELTAGSTWHAVGLTTFFHPIVNFKRMNYHSINLFTEVERETGQDVGFHRCGSLRLATSEVRLHEMKYQMSRQGSHQAPQKLVNPDEMFELCPLLDTKTIVGGLYNPYDGYIDPYLWTSALAQGARQWGAKVKTGVGAKSLKPTSNNEWVIETSDGGSIRTKHVINVAGFWAREVGLLAGLEHPLIPVEHQYVITGPIKAVEELTTEIPVLRHLDGSLYLRQERKGLLVGPYEATEKVKMRDDWVNDGVPPGFGKELYAEDLDRISNHLEIAAQAMPCFGEGSITRVVCGPMTYTPDLAPLVGPTRLPGYWVAAGFGYGIIQSGGVGYYLSKWIADGEPPWDMHETDPLRFGDWVTTSYTSKKAQESYGLNNSPGYPFDERYIGRPTRRISGAYQSLLSRGAHMAFSSGWEVPAWFHPEDPNPKDPRKHYKPSFYRTNWHDAVGREHAAVTQKAGVIDLSAFAKFEVTGSSSRRLLDHVCANTLPPEGRTRIAHWLTPKGRVYAEVTVTCLGPQRYMIVTGAGSELHDVRWLEEQARKLGVSNDVSVKVLSEDLGCLSVAGPKSVEIMKRLTKAGDNVEKHRQFTAHKIPVGDVNVTSLRMSYTGEKGWELYCDKRDTDQLYQKIIDAGKDLGIADFGSHALNVLRLEKRFRLWGNDMGIAVTPLEAGLDPYVKMNKDNFIGKSALQAQLRSGLDRRLVFLAVSKDAKADPHGDETVRCCGKVVGYTTSGCFSYALGQPIAFAYVPPYLTIPGSVVEVELMGEHYKSTVLAGPAR